jgi:RNA polymerase sigma-70 factor (ECF subfamily)
MLAAQRSAKTRMTDSVGIANPEAQSPAHDGRRDLELVRLALAARPADQQRLIERMMCVPGLLHALNARMGSPLSDDELADVGQSTATLVWRKLASFNGQSSLETWFYGIARFELMNALRHKRLRTSEEFVDENASAREEASDLDVEGLRSALERLDAEQAEVVRLHHFEDLTLEQCGQRLGLSLSAAKRRYYRAVERLQAFLGGARGGGSG